MSYIKEFLKNRSEIGSWFPSSRFLGKKMYGRIDYTEAKCIVEFGPGNGVFTNEILKRMNPDAILLIFETNVSFYNILKKEIKDKRAVILNESAEKIGEYLEIEGFEKADHIISSLPLMLIPKKIRLNIIKNAVEFLKESGEFMQFQYSFNSLKHLKSSFNSVKVGFTFLNLPPSIVYRCKK